MTATSDEKRDTIVLGASAGGIEALLRLLPALGAEIDASVLLVQHLPADGQSVLDKVLERVTALPVSFATDGEAILPRRIYIAPADRHLLVSGDRLHVAYGARENRARPAIDPLFRSAAASRRGRVMAAVLSGLLDDGAAGLVAVKRCGGLAFVQAPDDATEPEMPERSRQALGDALDGALAAGALGQHLAQLVGQPAPKTEVPPDVLLELRMLLGEEDALGILSRAGPPSPLSCPECGGPLWSVMDGRLTRYRCHTGHVFSPEALISAQARQIEQALWAAIKGLEQRSLMLNNLARDENQRSRAAGKARFEDEAKRLAQHALTLRDLLTASFRGPGDGG